MRRSPPPRRIGPFEPQIASFPARIAGITDSAWRGTILARGHHHAAQTSNTAAQTFDTRAQAPDSPAHVAEPPIGQYAQKLNAGRTVSFGGGASARLRPRMGDART